MTDEESINGLNRDVNDLAKKFNALIEGRDLLLIKQALEPLIDQLEKKQREDLGAFQELNKIFKTFKEDKIESLEKVLDYYQVIRQECNQSFRLSEDILDKLRNEKLINTQASDHYEIQLFNDYLKVAKISIQTTQSINQSINPAIRDLQSKLKKSKDPQKQLKKSFSRQLSESASDLGTSLSKSIGLSTSQAIESNEEKAQKMAVVFQNYIKAIGRAESDVVINTHYPDDSIDISRSQFARSNSQIPAVNTGPITQPANNNTKDKTILEKSLSITEANSLVMKEQPSAAADINSLATNQDLLKTLRDLIKEVNDLVAKANQKKSDVESQIDKLILKQEPIKKRIKSNRREIKKLQKEREVDTKKIEALNETLKKDQREIKQLGAKIKNLFEQINEINDVKFKLSEEKKIANDTLLSLRRKARGLSEAPASQGFAQSQMSLQNEQDIGTSISSTTQPLETELNKVSGILGTTLSSQDSLNNQKPVIGKSTIDQAYDPITSAPVESSNVAEDIIKNLNVSTDIPSKVNTPPNTLPSISGSTNIQSEIIINRAENNQNPIILDESKTQQAGQEAELPNEILDKLNYLLGHGISVLDASDQESKKLIRKFIHDNTNAQTSQILESLKDLEEAHKILFANKDKLPPIWTKCFEEIDSFLKARKNTLKGLDRLGTLSFKESFKIFIKKLQQLISPKARKKALEAREVENKAMLEIQKTDEKLRKIISSGGIEKKIQELSIKELEEIRNILREAGAKKINNDNLLINPTYLNEELNKIAATIKEKETLDKKSNISSIELTNLNADKPRQEDTIKKGFWDNFLDPVGFLNLKERQSSQSGRAADAIGGGGKAEQEPGQSKTPNARKSARKSARGA